MRLAALAPLFLLLSALACFGQAAAQPQQHDAALRINGVGPYPRVAPGQIVELRVEGFENRGAAGYSAPAVATFEPSERR